VDGVFVEFACANESTNPTGTTARKRPHRTALGMSATVSMFAKRMRSITGREKRLDPDIVWRGDSSLAIQIISC
jgi:hypothetical protein